MQRFMKRISTFLFLAFSAQASEQILLVVTADMNRSNGTLQRFEKHGGAWQKTGAAFDVNLGRNGLGWGDGLMLPAHRAGDPVKREGDGRAPAGVFTLGNAFGYAPEAVGKMPYTQATVDLICVDDGSAATYNRLVAVENTGAIGSFEWMRRPDGLYRHGLVVNHNQAQLPQGGSCIFLHIQSAPGAPTSGCTSMTSENLLSLLRWLDPDAEPLLIQVPAYTLPGIKERFALP